MCTVLFYTATGLAAVSDPNAYRYTGPPPPPLPKCLYVSFRFAATLQHLVATSLAGKADCCHSFQRIHLN